MCTRGRTGSLSCLTEFDLRLTSILMVPAPPIDLSIRSYNVDGASHTHDFAQLVLPISGALNIEVEGREHRVAPGLAAFVSPSARHAQGSADGNRSIVLDIEPSNLGAGLLERLDRAPCLALSQSARRLLDYAQLVLGGEGFGPVTAGAWVSLILSALQAEQTEPRTRLSQLIASVEANPGMAWTLESMAARAGLSIRRLHAIFQRDLATAPRTWLSKLRVDHIGEELVHSDLPIAELAYRYGFADQSALTRAFRRQTGFTPAEYRLRCRAKRMSSAS